LISSLWKNGATKGLGGHFALFNLQAINILAQIASQIKGKLNLFGLEHT